jgi:serine/threonine protein kinase
VDAPAPHAFAGALLHASPEAWPCAAKVLCAFSERHLLTCELGSPLIGAAAALASLAEAEPRSASFFDACGHSRAELEAALERLKAPPERGALEPALRGSPPGLPDVWREYEQGRLLGEGGYGAVYAARSRRTDEAAAVKLQHARAAADAALHEVAALSLLPEHPHVVRLLGTASDGAGGGLAIAYELFGTSLYAHLQATEALPPERAGPLAAGVLRGVAFLHAHGFVHGDLSSGNVLVSQGHAKVADLGMTVYAPPCPGARAHTRCTMWYRAPEALVGEPASQAGDLWALGCLLCEMLHGFPVFRGDSPEDGGAQLAAIVLRLGAPSARAPASVRAAAAGMKRARGSFESYCLGENAGSPASELAMDAASALLRWDPESRRSAADALREPFFGEEALPKQQPHPVLRETVRLRRSAALGARV